MDHCERKRLITKSYISPPRMLIESILEKVDLNLIVSIDIYANQYFIFQMLFIMVHEDFGLDTVHLIDDKDARYMNHLKIISKRDTSTILYKSKLTLLDNRFILDELIE